MTPAAVSADANPLPVLIIGTGFGGIGMAIALLKAGVNNVLLLERAQDVGGVWRDNGYPGAACDVPSHLYSFSFEPNAEWSSRFASQPEIHAYLRRCVAKYGLAPRIRFGAEVKQAEYDEHAALWRVTLTSGECLQAALLVTATGQLSQPRLAHLPGIERFKGRSFHSAQWDHTHTLAGKRVAVVGTGASAIQFVPAIAGTVQQLTVFQRTPPHLLPRDDRAYTERQKARFRRWPCLMKLHRASIYVRFESRALAFTRFKGLMQIAVGMPFQAMLKRQVPDAALRAQLTPTYPIGCKRILLSSNYLATLSRPNVTLVTQAIRRVTEDGVETTDGTHHAADTLIHGTGFAAAEFLSPMRITGRGGLNLNDAWRNGAAAYLGLTVPGFPNLFMLYGPNTNLGHNSIVYMLESQIAHVMRCWRAMKAQQASSIEVDALRHQRFNAKLQQALKHTVWNGCKSWYLDAAGHNGNNWPGFTLTYRWLTRFTSLRAYTFGSPARGP